MSRKLIAIFAALVIAASLCACNDVPEETTKDNTIEIPHESDTGSDETETGDIVVPPVIDDSNNPGDLEYTEKNDKIYVLAPSGALNLRTGDYVIKTSVKTGTELQRIALSTDGVWSKILYEGEELYVNNKYTTMLSDLDEGFTAVEKTLVSVGSLKIHIAPEEDYDWQIEVKIVGWYTEGEEIKVVAVNNETGYYKVEFTPYGSDDTAFGYITSNEKYFVNDEETTSAPAEETTDASTAADG